MTVDRRYQVFVSSTFRDLQEERQEVIQALLELDCIPSGMELFPAANEDQWTLITRVIDDCDYYIVIVAGRYGSVAPDGISYTRKEYEYAVKQNKPVIAFLHESPDSIPAGKSETDAAGRENLKAFRQLCEQRVCKYWSSGKDLGGKVSRSIIRLMKSHPAVGWVRGDNVPDESAVRTINLLREKVEQVTKELQRIRREPPKGTEGIAQGDDRIVLSLAYTDSSDPFNKKHRDHQLSWNDVFAGIAPCMIREASDYTMKTTLAEVIKKRDGLLREKEYVEVNSVDFHKVVVQLRALGLIAPSEEKRSVKDRGVTYWSLTPFGDEQMNRLLAIPRPTA